MGLLPVGNFQYTGVSAPVVQNGKVTGYLDHYIADRKFPVDMACMCVNINFWLRVGAPLMKCSFVAHMETLFLEDMKISMDEIEPKAQNATNILVWHTQTVKQTALKEFVRYKNISDSNMPSLLKQVVF